MTDFDRCIDFVYGIAERAATEKVKSPYGIAYLNLELPDVWGRNYLLATDNVDQASAEQLSDETDRIMGGAGLTHRKVELIDAAAGDRLAAGFRRLGWNSECDVLMVAKRDPDRLTDTSSIDEVTLDELVPAWTDGWRTDRAVVGEKVIRQLIENKRRLGDVVETRFFAANVEGEVASYCELYSDGSTGQIENVLTLPRFRNRGLARATVMRALQESGEVENDLTFLIADRDDWPKQLYAKLGFDEIGHIWEFVLPPHAK